MTIDAIVISRPFVFYPEKRIAFRVLLTAKISWSWMWFVLYMEHPCAVQLCWRIPQESHLHTIVHAWRIHHKNDCSALVFWILIKFVAYLDQAYAHSQSIMPRTTECCSMKAWMPENSMGCFREREKKQVTTEMITHPVNCHAWTNPNRLKHRPIPPTHTHKKAFKQILLRDWTN
jgi:hypothetical protein